MTQEVGLLSGVYMSMAEWPSACRTIGQSSNAGASTSQEVAVRSKSPLEIRDRYFTGSVRFVRDADELLNTSPTVL
jgi:hypothetical protein